jgi:hypothetical protein
MRSVGAVVTAFGSPAPATNTADATLSLASAALGKQQLDLKGTSDRASAAMLSELVRRDLDSRELQHHYEDLFRDFLATNGLARLSSGWPRP